jgi:hypothetical protein
MAEGNCIDWRELCAAAAKESDSKKLADLVDQIIKALDDRAQRIASPKQFGPAVRQNKKHPAPPMAQ